MTDELARPRTKKQNAEIREALAGRVASFEEEINAKSEASTSPRADLQGPSHPSDVHVRLPNTHAELQEHMMEHHNYDEESAETWSHTALIGQHNDLHANPAEGDIARQYVQGWHFHARPMRGV